MENIKEKVDEIIKWEKIRSEAAAHLSGLKAEFLEIGIEELSKSKIKTTAYIGDAGNRVQIQESEKLDVVSAEKLKNILGSAAKEYVTEVTKYDLSSKLVKIITPLISGNYEEGTIAEVLSTLTDDSKKLALLNKKIKGNFKKDVTNLQLILDMPEEEAISLAYKLEEIGNYEKIVVFAKAVKPESYSVEEFLNEFKDLFFVEDTVRLSIDYEK